MATTRAEKLDRLDQDAVPSAAPRLVAIERGLPDGADVGGGDRTDVTDENKTTRRPVIFGWRKLEAGLSAVTESEQMPRYMLEITKTYECSVEASSSDELEKAATAAIESGEVDQEWGTSDWQVSTREVPSGWAGSGPDCVLTAKGNIVAWEDRDQPRPPTRCRACAEEGIVRCLKTDGHEGSHEFREDTAAVWED